MRALWLLLGAIVAPSLATNSPTTSAPTLAPSTSDMGIVHYGKLCNATGINTATYTAHTTPLTGDYATVYHAQQRFAEFTTKAAAYLGTALMPSHICASTITSVVSTGTGIHCVGSYYLSTPHGYPTNKGGVAIAPILTDYQHDTKFVQFSEQCMLLCHTLYGMDNCAGITVFNDMQFQFNQIAQYLYCTPMRNVGTLNINVNCDGAAESAYMADYMAMFTPNRLPARAPTRAQETRAPTHSTTTSATTAHTPTSPGPTTSPTSMPTPDLHTTLEYTVDGIETEDLYNRCASNDEPAEGLAELRTEISDEFHHHLYQSAVAYLGVDGNKNHLPWVGELSEATVITSCVKDGGTIDIGFEVDELPDTIHEINLIDRECTWSSYCASYEPRFKYGKCYPNNEDEQLGYGTADVTGMDDYTANYCRDPGTGDFVKCTSCVHTKIYNGADLMRIWHAAVGMQSLSMLDTVFVAEDNSTIRGAFNAHLEANAVVPATVYGTSDDSLSDEAAVGIALGCVAMLGVSGFAVYRAKPELFKCIKKEIRDGSRSLLG